MLLICWKFTQKSCWLLNHVIYWHRCRAFQHLSPKVHRQKRFSLFKQRHCLPLSCQMALVLVLLFISGSLNGIETKNCFDLNVQARFEIPKGLYCVGEPLPKDTPLNLNWKSSFLLKVEEKFALISKDSSIMHVEPNFFFGGQ